MTTGYCRERGNMWSYGLDLRSIKLTVVKVVVSSEGTYNTVGTAYYDQFGRSGISPFKILRLI